MTTDTFSEQSFEVIQDEGGTTIVTLRPLLGFVAETYSCNPDGVLQVFGQGHAATFQLSEEDQGLFAEDADILLIEFPEHAEASEREMLLSRSEPA